MNANDKTCELCGNLLKYDIGGIARVCLPVPVEIYTKWLLHSVRPLIFGGFEEKYYILEICNECRAKYEVPSTSTDKEVSYFFDIGNE